MIIKVLPPDLTDPPTKVANVELVFEDGILAGLKLIGFAVWRTSADAKCHVTLPSRTFIVGGVPRVYSLLRPVSDTELHDQLRAVILQAYEEYVRFRTLSADAPDPSPSGEI